MKVTVTTTNGPMSAQERATFDRMLEGEGVQITTQTREYTRVHFLVATAAMETIPHQWTAKVTASNEDVARAVNGPAAPKPPEAIVEYVIDGAALKGEPTLAYHPRKPKRGEWYATNLPGGGHPRSWQVREYFEDLSRPGAPYPGRKICGGDLDETTAKLIALAPEAVKVATAAPAMLAACKAAQQRLRSTSAAVLEAGYECQLLRDAIAVAEKSGLA